MSRACWNHSFPSSILTHFPTSMRWIQVLNQSDGNVCVWGSPAAGYSTINFRNCFGNSAAPKMSDQDQGMEKRLQNTPKALRQNELSGLTERILLFTPGQSWNIEVYVIHQGDHNEIFCLRTMPHPSTRCENTDGASRATPGQAAHPRYSSISSEHFGNRSLQVSRKMCFFKDYRET